MRPLVIFLSMAILLGGCAAAPEPSPPDSRAPSADLTDPIVAAEVGSPPFSQATWERRAGRWVIVGDGPLPQPTDIEIIQAATSDIPPALTTEPRQLIKTASASVAADHPASGAIAVAKGPDIYLLDAAFTGTRSASRWSVGRVLVHELVHVAQWYQLGDGYVAATRSGAVTQPRLDDGSNLVADWASSTGWVDDNADSLITEWRLTGVAPNDYATTGPAEDMAESVSLAASGLGDFLDPDRRAWVERWTGTTFEELAFGKPWAPLGATEVISASPLYETEWLDTLEDELTHIEPLYFEIPRSTQLADLAATLDAKLHQRGFVGTLQTDESDTRYTGLYNLPDGSKMWVEANEAQSGTEQVLLLVYVWAW